MGWSVVGVAVFVRRLGPAWWTALALVVVLAGCGSLAGELGLGGGGAGPIGTPAAGGAGGASAVPVATSVGGVPAEGVSTPVSGTLYAMSPTATAYPTFTPVPTPTLTPTPVPTATPAPTSTPEPPRVETPLATPEALLEGTGATAVPGATTVVDAPSATPGGEEGSGALVEPTPVPEVYGQLYNAPVRLLAQSLMALQRADLPAYLKQGEWRRLPESAQVVSQRTPYVFWYVMFDVSEAPRDFRMDGWVRWLSYLGDLPPLVMHETSVRLSNREPLFYVGLGTDAGGLWRPGKYRMQFLDDRFDPVVEWDFEVR